MLARKIMEIHLMLVLYGFSLFSVRKKISCDIDGVRQGTRLCSLNANNNQRVRQQISAKNVMTTDSRRR